MIIQERLNQLSEMELLIGTHADNNGKCALEAVAWLAGEPHSDHPRCVSPVLAAFCRNWNDYLDDTSRQKLKPYLPRLISTAGNRETDIRRSWLAFDWLVRECGPAFMDLTPNLHVHAATLRALPKCTDMASLEFSRAAMDTAWVAAWDAARDAAWVAAGVAAWVAAGVAAGVAARDAAWAAAGVAAGVAARDAARDAAWVAAWDAAGVAAWDALASTVTTLQSSAFRLLDRMIDA